MAAMFLPCRNKLPNTYQFNEKTILGERAKKKRAYKEKTCTHEKLQWPALSLPQKKVIFPGKGFFPGY